MSTQNWWQITWAPIITTSFKEQTLQPPAYFRSSIYTCIIADKTPDYSRIHLRYNAARTLHNYNHLSPKRTIWKHAAKNTTTSVGECHIVSTRRERKPQRSPSLCWVHSPKTGVARIAPPKAIEDVNPICCTGETASKTCTTFKSFCLTGCFLFFSLQGWVCHDCFSV